MPIIRVVKYHDLHGSKGIEKVIAPVGPGSVSEVREMQELDPDNVLKELGQRAKGF